MVQFARFLLVGVGNTAVGLSIIFVAMWLFRLDYRLANGIGYAIGFGLSFLLNRTWTFRYRGRWSASLVRWGLLFGIGYGLNLGTVVALRQNFRLDPYLAQLGGVFVYTFVTYIGARFFVFPSRRPLLTMDPT